MNPTDSSEWLSTKLLKLSQLDSLQRCLICKDFLQAPVITSCNHTFCSICIRQHLQNVSSCPLCKAEQFESNLKRVILLEEIVSCYKLLRSDLLTLLQKQSTDETGDSKKSPDSKIEVVEIPDEEPSNQNAHSPDDVQCPVCSEYMAADHLQKSHLDYCLNGEKEPADVLSKSRMSKMQKTAVTDKKRGGISLFFQSQKRARPSPPPKEEVDHQQFYFNEAHKHHREAKRLPKIDYSSLSTSKVKEKLAALKLSTQGTRTELELRYNQYYLLHNSNIDLNHPVSDLELRKRLNHWEKSNQGFIAGKGLTALSGDKLTNKALSDKDFPTLGWLTKYKEEFSALVKTARASSLKKRTDVTNSQQRRFNSTSVPDSESNPLPHEAPRCRETGFGSIPSSPHARLKISDIEDTRVPLKANMNHEPSQNAKLTGPTPQSPQSPLIENKIHERSDEEIYDFSNSVLSSSR